MTRVPMIALQALLLVLCGLGIGWALGRRPDPRLVAQLAGLRTLNLQLDSAVQAYRAAGPAADTVVEDAEPFVAANPTAP